MLRPGLDVAVPARPGLSWRRPGGSHSRDRRSLRHERAAALSPAKSVSRPSGPSGVSACRDGARLMPGT